MSKKERPLILAHLGLDLAKDKFDAAVLTAPGALHHQSFERTAGGLAALRRWLQALGVQIAAVVMEATDLYFELPAQKLHAAGFCVHVVNPAQAKRFAQALLTRGKNDRLDAEVLARLAQVAPSFDLVAWSPPPPERRELLALTRTRSALVAQRAALRQPFRQAQGPEPAEGQAGAAACASARGILRGAANDLSARVRTLEAKIAAHLRAHPELQRQIELLVSIPGVGAATAALLLAELTHLPADAGRRALAAYAGLNPAQNQSGHHAGQSRLSKTGNARLRAGLYLPALTARRHIAAYAALADRLTAKGRKPLQAIAAIMRKLLLLAATLLRTGKPYNPAHLANAAAPHRPTKVPPEPALLVGE